VEEDAQVTEDTKPRLEKVILAKPGMLTLLKREPHHTHLKSILNLLATIAEIQFPRMLRLSGAIPQTPR